MTGLSRRTLLAAAPAALITGRPAQAAPPAPGVRTSGTAPTQLAGYDNLLKKFVMDRQIRAAQLAIMKNGKILLARGYTYDDYSRAPAVPSPTSLFRIASLSKNITSAAVMRLVQDGKLSLSAKVTSCSA